MRLLELRTGIGEEKPWKKGRQKGGYGVLPILVVEILERYAFDILLLKYPEGTYIPPHRDPEVGLRINWLLKKSPLDGQFKTKGKYLRLGRLTIFRPSRQTHWVTRAIGGERLVLSIGIGNGSRYTPSKEQLGREEIHKDVKDSLKYWYEQCMKELDEVE